MSFSYVYVKIYTGLEALPSLKDKEFQEEAEEVTTVHLTDSLVHDLIKMRKHMHLRYYIFGFERTNKQVKT